jgi:hypothetical protein
LGFSLLLPQGFWLSSSVDKFKLKSDVRAPFINRFIFTLRFFFSLIF